MPPDTVNKIKIMKGKLGHLQIQLTFEQCEG